MDQKWGRRFFLEVLVPAHMVKVPVGIDDGFKLQVVFLKPREDPLGLVSRIDDRRLPRLLISQNETIGLNRPHH